jgi:hypothetical protein
LFFFKKTKTKNMNQGVIKYNSTCHHCNEPTFNRVDQYCTPECTLAAMGAGAGGVWRSDWNRRVWPAPPRRIIVMQRVPRSVWLHECRSQLTAEEWLIIKQHEEVAEKRDATAIKK